MPKPVHMPSPADAAGNEGEAVRLLRQADADAERLLGFIRVAIATVLGLTLTLASRAVPASVPSDFVAKQITVAWIILAAYAAIGLVAVWLVTAGRYKAWMAWPTALADVLLVSGNVWLSLNNAALTANFAFAYPSALLLPMVIAFGALRYRPAITMTVTGLLVAAMVAIVFTSPGLTPLEAVDPSRLMITFNTPPNIIRLLILLAIGVTITIAGWRSRELLRRVADVTERQTNAVRFLPRGLSDYMTDEAIARLKQGRTARLAIMFIDIRNFTHTAEILPPHDVSRLLSAFRSNIMDTTEACNGIVDKFIGDGALVIFGLQGSPAEGARDAVDAGRKLLEATSELNLKLVADGLPPLACGIGIHVDDSFIGAVGDDRRLEFTVLGDGVNVASRIEQLTKSLNYPLLASTAVIELGAQGDLAGWTALGPHAPRGRENAVELWGYRPEAA